MRLAGLKDSRDIAEEDRNGGRPSASPEERHTPLPPCSNGERQQRQQFAPTTATSLPARRSHSQRTQAQRTGHTAYAAQTPVRRQHGDRHAAKTWRRSSLRSDKRAAAAPSPLARSRVVSGNTGGASGKSQREGPPPLL